MRLSRRTWLAVVMGGGIFGRHAAADDRGLASYDGASHMNPLDGFLAFDTDSIFSYFIGPETSKLGDNLMVLLLHTTAKNGEKVTGQNSQVIIQLAHCKNGRCSTKGFVGGSPGEQVSWTFERNPDYTIDESNLSNYFVCLGSRSEGGIVCKSYGNFFDFITNTRKTSSNGQVDSKPGTGSTGLGGAAPGGSNGESANVNSAANDEGSESDESRREAIRLAHMPASISEPIAVPTSDATPYIIYKDIPAAFSPTRAAPTTISTSSTTVTAGATSTATTPNVSPSSGNAGGSKLSTGAIVGIALGVLVVVSLLAALAVFFCLRRRRAQSGAQKHEQVMLTHAGGENNSQDLLAEKEGAVHTLIHPNSNDSNFSRHDVHNSDSALRQTLIPASGAAYDSSNRGHDRHDSAGDNLAIGAYRDVDESHTSPYNQGHTHALTDSTPAPFIAASTANKPRRNPTNASMAPSAVSALSRNTSVSTTVSRPRSPSLDYPPHTQLQDIGEEPSTTRSSAHFDGQARYGETRHTPTFHTAGNGSVSIVPSGAIGGSSTGGFLSEPGMSPAEMARLEDEERRIDLAIAEAERERERERALR